MKDNASGKILYLDPDASRGMEVAPVEETTMPAEALDAIVDSLFRGGYDPVVQLASYLIANDPTFLPNDTEARSLAYPVGRDKLLEALLNHYLAHRDHE